MQGQTHTEDFAAVAARGSGSWLRGTPVRLTMSLGLLAALLLVAMSGYHWASLTAGVALIATGYFAGRAVDLRHADEIARFRRSAAEDLARAGRLWTRSTPIWVRQIETVRGDADAEVAQLTRLFGEITRRLDKAMLPSQLAGGAGSTDRDMLATLARSGTDMNMLVEALQSLQASKQRIVADIGAEAEQLKENAFEIRQIAMQTRIVALNATIEAARAGLQGKPFAVVAAGMRELAMRTADASEQFSRHSDRLHGQVRAAFDDRDQLDGSAGSIAWAQDLVQQVIQRFERLMQELTRSLKEMEQERSDVKEDIARVLVSLQFQDRASQILSHVTRHLQMMQAEVDAGRWSSMDDRQWILRMASIYSTPEEFANQEIATRPAAAPPPSEVTYF